jgi:hypothetical protein
MNVLEWLKFYPVLETLFSVALLLGILLWKKPVEKTTPSASRRWFLVLRRRPWIAYFLIGFLAFTASALLTFFAGLPQPCIHDEFSYLLAADTFAQGRLANPPHPFWKHFETFHVIQQPTYVSKYPPAQGLTLALGQVIFGHPIVGVWLSVGLAGASICWMLAGWVPLRWACLGGLVAVIRIVFSRPAFLDLSSFAYWSQSYWGGVVAALGGALVFGALLRIMKNPRRRDALWLGVGLAILANSRPFEGLVASVPVVVILGIWLVRSKSVSWSIRLGRVALPLVLVLLLTAVWMGFYNFRVTGNPFLMPYQIYESTYGIVPPFLWKNQKSEPQYNHEIMRNFHKSYIDNYLEKRSFKGFFKHSMIIILSFWFSFFSNIFFLSMLFLVLSEKVWRRRNVIFPAIICTLMMIALLSETWFFPHYAAPVAGLCYLLIVESLRQTRRVTWQGKPVGRLFVRAVLPVLLISSIASFAAMVYYHQRSSDCWCLDRAKIMRELGVDEERHLIIVRYGPDHSPHDEWVYNRADIDRAQVVWAREMGFQADRKLLEYFKDRRVWLLQADQLPRQLIQYPGVHLTIK